MPAAVSDQKTLEPRLAAKLVRLKALLVEMESVAIAYSGGVDSTFLLRAAMDIRSIKVIAVTTDSPTNTREETVRARDMATAMGARHIVEQVNELDTPGYSENPINRCYLCKHTLYPLCRQIAEQEGMRWVADGVNTDDLGDYRPGLVAAEEYMIRHPLVEADMSKGDIRSLSRQYGLPTADMPASPCLSSRFPYGVSIDKERLGQVSRAEAAIKALGFTELRVRHLGNSARLEVAVGEQPRLMDPALRLEIFRRLEQCGFHDAEIAAKPLRSGSLNDEIPRERSKVAQVRDPAGQ